MPSKSDEEIAQIAGLDSVDIITQIREETEKAQNVEKVETEEEKKTREEKQRQQRERKNQKARETYAKGKGIRNAKKSERNEEKNKQEQSFRRALALGMSTKEIAAKFQYKSLGTVRSRKYKLHALGRKEIVELLPSKSDEEIAQMAKLDNVRIITLIRKEEAKKSMPQTIPESEETSKTNLKRNSERSCVIKTEGDKKANNRELTNKSMQIQREQTDIAENRTFWNMARNYISVAKIAETFNKSEYEIILKLRRIGIYSRDEVEGLIEQGKMTDEQIAGKVGDAQQVRKIRNLIRQREKLIHSISENQREKIRGMLSSNQSCKNIAYETKVSMDVIKAIQEKEKRDKKRKSIEQPKEVQFKIEWIKFEAMIKSINGAVSKIKREVIDYTIAKILVEYELLLEAAHYAYMAYTYMKIGDYKTGIEFAEEYLDLKEPSISGVKDEIEEVVQKARNKEKSETIVMVLPEIIEYTSR